MVTHSAKRGFCLQGPVVSRKKCHEMGLYGSGSVVIQVHGIWGAFE